MMEASPQIITIPDIAGSGANPKHRASVGIARLDMTLRTRRIIFRLNIGLPAKPKKDIGMRISSRFLNFRRDRRRQLHIMMTPRSWLGE